LKKWQYYQSKGVTFLEQLIEVNMDKIAITILQGSVVTVYIYNFIRQTMAENKKKRKSNLTTKQLY